MTDLEQQILNEAKAGIAESIKKELTGYNKPLSTLTSKVLEEYEPQLRSIFKKSMDKIINDPSFEKEIHSALNHKVAKVLVSQLEGSVDKAVNAIKNDPMMKSRMILAIERIIEEPQ